MNNLPFQIPRGPVISFRAIPFPLPQEERERLRALALRAKEARQIGVDSPEFSSAKRALDVEVHTIRDVFGVEMTRRSFLPGGAAS